MKNHFVLKKARKTLLAAYHRFCKKKKQLSTETKELIKKDLILLQTAIMQKKPVKAVEMTRLVQTSARTHLGKTFFESTRDFILGIAGALFIAVLIRQMWFELYEIPTGSMRPTFKELDRLSVSKTDFGVNFPLKLGHFYFNPDLIKRNNIVIFTVENMDVRDANTVYFYLFPGKKLLVKRVIGKPGDTVYFYGGKVYGIDEAGQDITPELQLPQLEKIDHIPFISFEGTRVSTTPSVISGIYSPVIIYQMNEPIARLYATSPTQARGDLFPKILLQHPRLDYGDLWGIKNFAMARLLTKEQVRVFTDQDPSTMEEGVLYLELKHHPSLSGARIGTDEYNRVRPLVGLSTSVIPLQDSHLKAIMENLYTARFIVSNGFSYRYGINPERYGTQAFFPYLPTFPNGTYEYYYGKAYSVKWQGITSELPPTSALYRYDPQQVQLLFNIGMEFDNRYSPQSKEQYLVPSRYAYYRDADLYLMGAPILKKDDPTLTNFIERENKRQSLRATYAPFVDQGPPLDATGKLNIEFIKQYGLKVPPKSYLCLGDNHANSGDSRDFGFVPEENLRGGPVFIFWPFGNRFGAPNQPSYPFLNPGRIIIWSLALVGFGSWYYVHRRRNKLPLSFD
ncbi:MAG TPA: signal peptidase I [Rhabdochlamydiaceae bacterium]|jgi:signal peptidase I|nr:signal peptidase I [Rhabdochlamydiaceae bacterium]